MRFLSQIILTVGSDGEIILREPTNVEWNTFQTLCYPTGRQADIVRMDAAREELFDQLVVGLKNIEDDDGVLTIENCRKRIPARRKVEMILRGVEAYLRIGIKN